MISEQVSSLICMQWLSRKCKTNGSKYVEIRDPFCIQLFAYTFKVNFLYKLYIIFMMYTFSTSKLVYTKFIENVCIQMYPTFQQTFVYILHTKCIQNIYKIFVYKMYPTFQQTFIYKMYRKCWYIKCIPHFDKLLYTFCIQKLDGTVLVS